MDVGPDTPLLWAWRDILDLHGTKYRCGMGLCGACTALIAPRPCEIIDINDLTEDEWPEICMCAILTMTSLPV